MTKMLIQMAKTSQTSTKRENVVQGTIMTWLRARKDIFVLRVQADGSGNKGVSDCVLCHCGQFIGIEFKRDLHGSYGVTKAQEIRGRQIKHAGGQWYAVDSLAEVKDIIAENERRYNEYINTNRSV